MERTSRLHPSLNPYQQVPQVTSHKTLGAPQDASSRVHELLQAGNRESVIHQLASLEELELSSYPLDDKGAQILGDALCNPRCHVQHLTLAMSDSATHIFQCLQFCGSITNLTLTPSHIGPGAVSTPRQLGNQARNLFKGLSEQKARLGTGLHRLTIPSTLESEALTKHIQNIGIQVRVSSAATDTNARISPASHLAVEDAECLAHQVLTGQCDPLDLSMYKSFGPGHGTRPDNAFNVLMYALKQRADATPVSCVVLDATSLSEADWDMLEKRVQRGDMKHLALKNLGHDRELEKRVHRLFDIARARDWKTTIDVKR